MEMMLDGIWQLRQEPLSIGIENAGEVQSRTFGWLDTTVPCDVRVPLIEGHLIKDPVVADHCFESEWIEERSWWFKKEFQLSIQSSGPTRFELMCGMLDLNADVFLNDVHLGNHRNAFRPFVADIGSAIRSGTNTLLIRVTTGLENHHENELEAFADTIPTEIDSHRGDRGDKRRVLLRKPQYVYGWDWCPRIVTCGIMLPVSIRMLEPCTIRSIHIVTRSTNSPAMVSAEMEIENLQPISSTTRDIEIVITAPDGERTVKTLNGVFIKSGLNYIETTIQITSPELWWPNGMGAQPLYHASVHMNGQQGYEVRFALRSIELDLACMNQDETGFAFRVNGIKVFCKGSNWIPADSIYSRVSDSKYRQLIHEAADSNFNMLRVWGGGLYEKDIFYDLCDEKGIMVWQDFMFACAGYPDMNPRFMLEVERELEHQTRRLRNHACLALWCGNNEIDQVMVSMENYRDKPTYPGSSIFHRLAPSIVHDNCPEIPYWPSSPYGGRNAVGGDAGDKHHWGECMMNPDIMMRVIPEEYDGIHAKFVSEYGYPGPCRIESIREYLGGTPLDRRSRIWSLHNNTFEKDTVQAGIVYHYGNAGTMDLDDYLAYASLCQGLMLGYSLESLRFNSKCWGALYWMFDDCWGETGWTTIDYYLRRKLSFYSVKRALMPNKMIMRMMDDRICILGINETSQPLIMDIEFGYVSFDGSFRHSEKQMIEMPPRSRDIIREIMKADHDDAKGVYYAMPLGREGALHPAILRMRPYRELDIAPTRIEVFDISEEENQITFRVSSARYAHGVHFGIDTECEPSDEYFDLLPGEIREVKIRNAVDLKWDGQAKCMNQDT